VYPSVGSCVVKNIRDRRIKHMKKVKQTNQNSQSYDAQLNQDRNCALQLYEKGILSADSLLEKMGYDPKQETDRRKNNSKEVSNGGGIGRYDVNPSWSILSNKIEHARRNAEMASKILSSRETVLGDDTMKQLEETLSDSLKILKETSNIK